MIATTFAAQDIFLIDDFPNFNSKGFSAEVSSVTDYQESLTKRETRRPWSITLRLRVRMSCTVYGTALRTLQASLRSLKAQPVVCPFWPAVTFWGDRAGMKISGGLLLAFTADFSQWEIYASGGAEPGWVTDSDQVVPLLWGFLNGVQSPAFSGSADDAKWDVDFQEAGDSAYALSFSAFSFTNGPTPSGYGAAPKILPFVPQYADITDGITVDVGRRAYKLRRNRPASFYPHDPYRLQRARVVLNGAAAVAKFLSWLSSSGSQGDPFWSVSALAVGVLAADSLAATTALVFEAGTVLPGDYIATWLPNGTATFAKVSTVVGTTVNLVAAFGTAFTAGQPFFALSLTRLDNKTVTLQFLSPVIASTNLSYQEVRPETVVPGSETLGTTIGRLPIKAVLLDFSRDFGNGTVSHYRFTSYEDDLTYAANVYTSGPFDCGEVPTSLNLEEDVTKVDSDLVLDDGTLFSSNPLVTDLILGSEAPLYLKMYHVLVASPVVTATLVFSGELKTLNRDGNTASAGFGLGSSIFDSPMPLLVKGTICPHLRGSPGDGTHLISQGCTGPDAVMTRSKWKFTAIVAAPLSIAWPFALHANTLTGVGVSAAAAISGGGVFANYFANGVIEWKTGANIQRRGVTGSTVPVAGALVFNLHRYFNGIPNVGDTITFYPGCDGLFATCKAFNSGSNPTGKFGNQLNYGGDPFIPIVNPSAIGQPNLGMSGSKK